MKTFNKRGDEGETSLLFGDRVKKNSLRCEAYGTLDEVVSCLGVARNAVTREKTKIIILKLQEEIFMVSAELATEPENYEKFASRFTPVTDEMVDRLEEMIVELESEIELPKAFIIPGSNMGSGLLDLSRAMVRRAERRVADLRQNNEISNNAIQSYMNRLADLLFMLGRYEET
ncbi:cob(I)yrinic acid a,c-diamide adenosyltransferase [Chloroflexota bacterium]